MSEMVKNSRLEPVVKQEITYYKEPQAGYVGWFVTKAGSYFIDENGIVRNVYGAGLKTDFVAEHCNDSNDTDLQPYFILWCQQSGKHPEEYFEMKDFLAWLKGMGKSFMIENGIDPFPRYQSKYRDEFLRWVEKRCSDYKIRIGNNKDCEI
jgi:hypothetical protein